MKWLLMLPWQRHSPDLLSHFISFVRNKLLRVGCLIDLNIYLLAGKIHHDQIFSTIYMEHHTAGKGQLNINRLALQQGRFTLVVKTVMCWNTGYGGCGVFESNFTNFCQKL